MKRTRSNVVAAERARRASAKEFAKCEEALKTELLITACLRECNANLKTEIERLKGNLLVAERNNGIEVTHLREQIQSQDQRIWQANFDVQFADATRRQAERDRDHYKAQMDLQGEKLIEQQTELRKYSPFNRVLTTFGPAPNPLSEKGNLQGADAIGQGSKGAARRAGESVASRGPVQLHGEHA